MAASFSSAQWRWLRSILALALVFTYLAGMVAPAQAVSPNIVISQVYGGGGNSGATYTHDYVELFNRGTVPASLAGWSIQYASATGTGNFGANSGQLTELPDISLAPGQYLLVGEASGGTAGIPLPTPNVIDGTPINMSGTAGKVALVNSTSSLGCNGGSTPCSPSALAMIVDLVGYGGANFFEGSGAAPALTNTTAALRNSNGATDTDNNAADFAAGAPNPRNTPPPINLTVTDVSANEGNSGTTSFDFTVSLASPAGAGGVTFDIATADNTATVANNDYVANSLTGQTIPASSSSYTFSVLVNGDTTAEPAETFFVNVTNVTGANVVDGQGQATIANDDSVAITPIHDIQGNGDMAAAGSFTVEAIVVGDYQTQGSGRLRGFFLQEENADADPATSEGIFVFCTTCPVPVSVGDKVRVTGASSEFFGMSQLTASTVESVSVLSSGHSLPTPASVQLPVPGVPSGDLALATAAINAYFEAFEGMLVTFPDTLSVSEYFELARYGQVILSEGGRPHTFTAANTPTAAGFINHEIDLASRTIILDDTDNRQNRPSDAPNTAYYHPVPGLSTGNFFRGGDTITNLTGVLHWSFAGQAGTDAWRIRPVTEAYNYAFTPVNPRPAVPSVDGSLKIASFNVLNYFLTIDTSNVCAPTQNQDCRGADSEQELQRQRTKMLAALDALDADIFGFMEMENTPGVEPLADIVAGLPGYDYVDTDVIGTDAIRVGIIYKTNTVRLVGNYAILDSSVDPRFIDTRNRPALAQTFEEKATGGRFTVVVNHLKSKGSGCGAGDDDTTTGQGNCNRTRTLAAQALADWLATDPTGSGDSDVLIIGDLNSYAKEDPIVALQDAGYTDMVAAFGGPDAYGYVFDGQLGYLDHALASPTLEPQVADVAEWHINADEIPLFDYNDDVRTADEAAFEEESETLPLYEPNEFRTSDHDPVIVGLDLVNAAPSAVNDSYTTNEDAPLTVAAPGVLDNDTDAEGHNLKAVLVSGPSASQGAVVLNSDGSFTFTPATNFNGTATFTYRANDSHKDSNIATVSITITPVNDPPVAGNDAFSVAKNGSGTVVALANDYDVDGDTLTVVSFTQGANGEVKYSAKNNNFRYTPKKGFSGTDTFTYTISDGQGNFATATVTVTVN
jgi:predicted extracellular nuclease